MGARTALKPRKWPCIAVVKMTPKQLLLQRKCWKTPPVDEAKQASAPWSQPFWLESTDHICLSVAAVSPENPPSSAHMVIIIPLAMMISNAVVHVV